MQDFRGDIVQCEAIISPCLFTFNRQVRRRGAFTHLMTEWLPGQTGARKKMPIVAYSLEYQSISKFISAPDRSEKLHLKKQQDITTVHFQALEVSQNILLCHKMS